MTSGRFSTANRQIVTGPLNSMFSNEAEKSSRTPYFAKLREEAIPCLTAAQDLGSPRTKDDASRVLAN